MTAKEKNCFWQLCRMDRHDHKKFETLLETAASPEVLGHLFFNRMAGIAYHVLVKENLLQKTSREFRNSLAGAYEQAILKNRSFYQCVSMLSDILRPCKEKYAMLKGAVLCGYYPEGCRTSNDVDLLADPGNISDLGQVLAEAGFCQGTVKNGVFIPASRREIMESKMMRGETVPYIKEVNLPYLQFLEVDMNYSLDYKNSDSQALQKMLNKSKELSVRGLLVRTLDIYDFIIHLCCHLYKEATTYPWVRMHRDMTLYKYSDIVLFLKSFSIQEVYELFRRAEELNLQDISACVILWCSMLYSEDISQIGNYAATVLKGNTNILNEVIAPASQKRYVYQNLNMRERFFCKDRCAFLKEIE